MGSSGPCLPHDFHLHPKEVVWTVAVSIRAELSSLELLVCSPLSQSGSWLLLARKPSKEATLQSRHGLMLAVLTLQDQHICKLNMS